jgi:hypothetical protein
VVRRIRHWRFIGASQTSVLIRRIHRCPPSLSIPAANKARPTQLKLAVAGQAEFVICDQSIERTFAWFNHHRRLSKDYERQEATSETMVHIVMIRVMLRRLSRI